MDCLMLSLASILVRNSNAHCLCPGFPILPNSALGSAPPQHPLESQVLCGSSSVAMAPDYDVADPDDYVLLLDCGVQGLTEVGIVKQRLAWRDMNPWKQGATASNPAGESPWELEPWLPMPGGEGLAWFALTA